MNIIGVMSGSSLDGLDFAELEFVRHGSSRLDWTIRDTQFVTYPDMLQKRLSQFDQGSLHDVLSLDVDLGKFIGSGILHHWPDRSHITCVASHGHTLLHRPGSGYSYQIGHGAHIASITRLPTITDLRSADIAAGGEGAPMAPLADRILFPEYEHFLNLGGIANLSTTTIGFEAAYDICPCNQWLNTAAQRIGLSMDADGKMARSGHVIPPLLAQLNDFAYYSNKPGSLGNQEVRSYLHACLDSTDYDTEDLLHTLVEHISSKVAAAFHYRKEVEQQILTTGGGAWNTYLIEQIQSKLPSGMQIKMPDASIVNFKEAALIALAGMCRWTKQSNFSPPWSSAEYPTIGGCIYWPPTNDG